MLIYLLDDEVQILPYLKNLIQTQLTPIHPDAVVQTFCQSDLFLQQVAQLPPDICFLDLDLGQEQMTGLLVAKQLRETLPDCQIVFLSNYLQYVTDAFDVNPTYYVLKDELQQRLPAVIAKMLQCYTPDTSGSLTVTVQRKRLMLPTNSILYLERVDRETKIVCTDQTLFTRETLPCLMKKLNTTFYRCHASFVVHFSAVEQMDAHSFRLCNGTAIPISRPNQEQARLQFSKYLANSLGF